MERREQREMSSRQQSSWILDRWRDHRVAFLGRTTAPRGVEPMTALDALCKEPSLRCHGIAPPDSVAWNRQIHSSRVRTVAAAHLCRDGSSAEGSSAGADALFTRETAIALTVFTADCVPVLVAGEQEAAAIHAGWRGLENGVIETALGRFASSVGDLVAWIGPAMGACCYEVGADVAHRVATESGPDVVDCARGHKPHLDLGGAALAQLSEAGVRDVRLLARCTGCSGSGWWSYRRGAERKERNLAFIWRQK